MGDGWHRVVAARIIGALPFASPLNRLSASSSSIVIVTAACIRRQATLPLVVLLAAALTGCGGDSTGPGNESHGPPGIGILAGADVTDTVDAVLPQALRVVVRDTNGRLVQGAVVRFSSVQLQGPGGSSVPSVLVGDLSAVGASTFLAETTSVNGEAFARLVMGRAAGAGAVGIEVPQAGLQARANFTIEAGAAANVVLPIADTTIQVGHAMPLAGRVEDRYGNPRTDAITYEVTGTGLTITSGQVRGSAPARARVLGRFGDLGADTTWVSVVPVATIAVRHGSRLVTAALDGTNLTEIPHTLDAEYPGPDWDPDGQSLLAVLGTFSGPRALYRVNLDGSTQQVIDPAAPSTGHMYDAAYSTDGKWVYFSAGSCNYAAILYRVSIADPQTVERLSPIGPDECFELVNHWPSVSPDGTRLTYENQTWNQQGYSVRVMDIATRAVTEIVPGGERPRWSPAGDLIAYWAEKQIWVVKPDGTGARVVSPAGHSYEPGVQWSPDGQWILARFDPTPGWAGTTVALINVSTRLEIPLMWTSGYGDFGLPAWKPGQ